MNTLNHDTELEEILAKWEFEVTGTPRHWEKTEERQAIDSRYKAVLSSCLYKQTLELINQAHIVGFEAKDGVVFEYIDKAQLRKAAAERWCQE